jgi:hypothetical protein
MTSITSLTDLTSCSRRTPWAFVDVDYRKIDPNIRAWTGSPSATAET